MELNGIEVHYQLEGEGPPVVLVHGLGLRGSEWRCQVPALCRAGYRVLSYDLRGHGSSGWEPSRAVDMKLLAGDLAALLQHLSLPRVHLVGFSLGGLVAQAFYAHYPDMVSSLVLAATYAFIPEPSRSQFLQERLQVLETEGLPALARTIARRSFSPSAPQPMVEAMTATVAANHPGAYREITIAASAADSTALLPHIRVPCLIIVGEEDITTPPDFSRYLQQNIPAARLEIIPGARHMLIQEQADLFNRSLLDFLAVVRQA